VRFRRRGYKRLLSDRSTPYRARRSKIKSLQVLCALRLAAREPSAERKNLLFLLPSAYPFSALRLGSRWANLQAAPPALDCGSAKVVQLMRSFVVEERES